ncbi:hypothetical protein JG687_00015151 [Phytophthora cactorum]|uniref:Uncharacterized protein n=1 Tax=Phytophthora cactorum TaxID=29920 RepID=A0A8T1TVA9_9STRA|nr:hypothetical protein JG687_00015151 [Phytophthora cactorum]
MRPRGNAPGDAYLSSRKMRETYRSDSSIRGLPPPLHDNQSRQQNILETRVMTLDKFLEQEGQMALAQAEYSPRPIPVLFLPGETPTKYEYRFESWLLRRNVTMRSLRDDPEVERRFRIDFADSRAWELRRHSVARSDNNLYSGHQNFRIRRRTELLATEVMTREEYFRVNEDEGLNGRMLIGERLRPIAVLLNP